MDASQKNKAVMDFASIRARRKSRASETAAEKKKEVEAALSRSRGIVIRSSEPRQTASAPKSSSFPLPAPLSKLIKVIAPPLVSSEMDKAVSAIDEEDSILIVRLVPSLDRPPLKRLRTSGEMEARKRSISTNSSEGKRGQREAVDDIRGCLEKIQAKARDGILKATATMYKINDELIQAYLDHMEEVGITSSKKEG